MGLTWRAVVLEVARWPIVLWAVANVLLGIKRPYMITPKGKRVGRPPSGRRLYGLYAVLAALGLVAVDLSDATVGARDTQGYVVLVLFNTLMLLALLMTTLSLELRDLSRSAGGLVRALRLRAATLFWLAALIAGACGSVAFAWHLLATGLQ
jgi:hypothetical protein